MADGSTPPRAATPATPPPAHPAGVVGGRAPVDGRMALTIGVTGHRGLAVDDLDLYRQRIEALFDDLHRRYPHTPLRVLSPLAEGADRLPVEIALARGYEVVAILPLAVADYAGRHRRSRELQAHRPRPFPGRS